MFGQLGRYLSSFGLTQDVAVDVEDEYESSSSEGAFEDCQSDVAPTEGSESDVESKEDCFQSEVEPKEDFRSEVEPKEDFQSDVEAKVESPDVLKEVANEEFFSVAQNSIYPPLDSIDQTPAVVCVQFPPLSTSTEAVSYAPKTNAVRNIPDSNLTSDKTANYFVELDPLENFVLHNPLVQSIDLPLSSDSTEAIAPAIFSEVKPESYPSPSCFVELDPLDNFVAFSPLVQSTGLPLSSIGTQAGPPEINSTASPPLSSIGTQAGPPEISSVALPSLSVGTQTASPVLLSAAEENAFRTIPESSHPLSDRNACCFVELDPLDNFVQYSPLVELKGTKVSSTGQIIYKTELQTFCQKSKTIIDMPLYSHVKQGVDHAPKFRTTVQVAGRSFESDSYHSSKAAADRDAAKKALTFLCPGFSNPLQRQSAQQRQQMPSNSASFEINASSGASAFIFDSVGSCSQTASQPVPSQERPAVVESPRRPSTHIGGSAFVSGSTGSNSQTAPQTAPCGKLPTVAESPPKPSPKLFSGTFSAGASGVAVKTESYPRKKRRADGSTVDMPIDLTAEEHSVGSSPPVTIPNSPARSPAPTARSQSAEYNYAERWGFGASFTEDSISSVDVKKPPPPDKAATPAEVDDSLNSDIARRFSGLHVNENPFHESRKPPSKPPSKTQFRQQFVPWPPQTDHLTALGKLSFVTHAFPLLARLNGLPLEEAYSVDQIEGLGHVPAKEVNVYLYRIDEITRPETCSPLSRAQTDSTVLLFDCHIDKDGGPYFRTTENKQGSTLLQRTLGFDRVLRVFFHAKFSEDKFKEFLKKGIFVGLRHYQYFVYKPADRLTDEDENKDSEGVKCYFVCTDSRAMSEKDDVNFRKFKSVTDVRSLFMHVHNCATVAKYIVRLQLCLSKSLTITAISFTEVSLEEMEDVPSKDPSNPNASFTDGTGFISADLAKLMPSSIFKGMTVEESLAIEIYEDYPTLIQVRFFHDGAAHKGTLLVNKTLPPKSIKFYKSMKKVESDHALAGHSISSFELVSSSRRPRRAKLSQDLIVLLTIGGVDGSIFINAVKQAAADVLLVLEDRRRALKEVLEWDWDSDFVETTLMMLAAGIPLQEPSLQKNLLLLIKNKMSHFAKGKVPLEGTFNLMGTADPSNSLKPHQVAIFLSDGGPVLGQVIVYRAPGKHPGDPHKLEAVHCPALQKFIGAGKSVILFSTQGQRPIPHEIAYGDLDGDMYWICHNKTVVEQFQESKRWSPGETNGELRKGCLESPKSLSPDKLEDVLIEEYLQERFNKCAVVGKASKQWLRHIDGYLNPTTSRRDKDIHEIEFLKYPDYIYEAVDIKSGKRLKLPTPALKEYNPPYLALRPGPDRSTTGKSILGLIFDVGSRAQGDAGSVQYGRDDLKPDPAFILEESKIHMAEWAAIHKCYLRDMTCALGEKEQFPNGPNLVNKKYKRILFEGPSFKEATKPKETVKAEASAIYQIVYERAAETVHLADSPRTSFAWNVAGPVLAFIYAEKQPGENCLVWAPDLYKQVHKRSKAQVSRA